MGVKIDINKIKFKTQNQPLVAPIIHLGAGDKKPTWNTFSKDSAIQYDACYGRLNPIGGRFLSLRPVVSRLCSLFSSSDSPIQNFNHIIRSPTFCSNYWIPWFLSGLPLLFIIVTNLRSLFGYWKSQSALNLGSVVLSALGNVESNRSAAGHD